MIPGRVSIGICTLNRSKLAVRAIRSALSQTYRDIEVIVSDDASDDDTLERVREIQDPRLVVFAQKPRLGIVGNPDFALRQATGEFWLFIGDDDFLMPTAIERLASPFLNSSAGYVGAAWCPCLVADVNGDRLWDTESGPPFEPVASMLAKMFAGNRGPRCSSILLRTQDALAVGGYDAKYGDLSDIGNWGRAALLNNVAACIGESLVQYTMHQGSTTSRSSVEKWQRWARLVHKDLLEILSSRGDLAGLRELSSAQRNFISGVTLTILIQMIGQPQWVRNVLLQSLRTPGAVFTPYMFRRLIKDGRKTFILRERARTVVGRTKALQAERS